MKRVFATVVSFWAGGFVALAGVVDSQLRMLGESFTPYDLLNLAIWPYHLVCYLWRVLL
jgi:hypothetical protein